MFNNEEVEKLLEIEEGFIKGLVLLSTVEESIYNKNSNMEYFKKHDIYIIYKKSIQELLDELVNVDFKKKDYVGFIVESVNTYSAEYIAEGFVQKQLPLSTKMELGVEGVLGFKILLANSIHEIIMKSTKK